MIIPEHLMQQSIEMEEKIDNRENQIYYHLSRIFNVKKDLEISSMFTKIAEADCIDDLKFEDSINKSQKGRVFYLIECTKHLSWEYEVETHPIYEAKSEEYKKKVDFKSFLLQRAQIDRYLAKLTRDIE